ncbi:unnamed protein product [Colias eurytheme]|nr:unnamed protein product [Colias eurytheme]
MRARVRKSASFQECRHVSSATSDASTSSSASESSDTPLKKFNRLLRSAVARRVVLQEAIRAEGQGPLRV